MIKKFFKLYCNAMERHTIGMIVFCSISIILILLLFFFPSGIVNAESSGSSASTSVIVGDSSDSDFDNYFQLQYEDGDSQVYRCNFPDGISSSFFEHSGLSGIKLSDMVECTALLDTTLPNTAMSWSGTCYHTLEDVQDVLDNTYLLGSSNFYVNSNYQYIIFDGEDYIDIWVFNCNDECFWSTRDGLIDYWNPDYIGSQKSYMESFSYSDFQCEIISVSDNGRIDYFTFDNPDIADVFGFWAYNDDDPRSIPGPFNYNSAACKNISSRSYVLASNCTYVDYESLQQYKIEGTLETKNGFNNVGELTESAETSLNNLYLDGANWNFDAIPKKYLDYNSKITFQCNGLTDYQMSHLSDFYNDFSFTITTKVRYNQFVGIHTGGGGGHSFGSSSSRYKFSENLTLNNYLYGVGSFYTNILYGTGVSIPKVDNYTFSYVNVDNTSYYRQTLEQFYNSGNTCTFWTRDYLFNHCKGLCKVSDDGTEEFVTFANYIYSLDQIYDDWVIDEVVITCNATIYDSSGSFGGNCKSSYNFVNGNVSRIDESLGYNPNPYYEENGSDVPWATSGNASSSSSVVNSGNITINNNFNPTLNNNTGSGSSGDTNIIIQLIHGIFSGGNEDLGELNPSNNGWFDWMGTNNWLQVLNQSFTYIPSSIFTALSLYFAVVCFILIAAFVLKIIVEFL